jgi:hypothetical protein
MSLFNSFSDHGNNGHSQGYNSGYQPQYAQPAQPAQPIQNTQSSVNPNEPGTFAPQGVQVAQGANGVPAVAQAPKESTWAETLGKIVGYVISATLVFGSLFLLYKLFMGIRNSGYKPHSR